MRVVEHFLFSLNGLFLAANVVQSLRTGISQNLEKFGEM